MSVCVCVCVWCLCICLCVSLCVCASLSGSDLVVAGHHAHVHAHAAQDVGCQTRVQSAPPLLAGDAHQGRQHVAAGESRGEQWGEEQRAEQSTAEERGEAGCFHPIAAGWPGHLYLHLYSSLASSTCSDGAAREASWSPPARERTGQDSTARNEKPACFLHITSHHLTHPPTCMRTRATSMGVPMHTASDPANMPDAALVKKGSGRPSLRATRTSLSRKIG